MPQSLATAFTLIGLLSETKYQRLYKYQFGDVRRFFLHGFNRVVVSLTMQCPGRQGFSPNLKILVKDIELSKYFFAKP